MNVPHKSSDMHLLKTTIEQLFGEQAWYDLKETSSLSTWRKYLIKTLDAIWVSINETIVIRDDDWLADISENLESGKSYIKKSKTFDNAISSFASTLIKQSFIQVGFMPNRSSKKSVNLRKENWKFDSHRSVLVVQNPAQVESAFWSSQQKKIGFDAQLELKREHRYSKSKQSYSQWCKNKKTEPEH